MDFWANSVDDHNEATHIDPMQLYAMTYFRWSKILETLDPNHKPRRLAWSVFDQCHQILYSLPNWWPQLFLLLLLISIAIVQSRSYCKLLQRNEWILIDSENMPMKTFWDVTWCIFTFANSLFDKNFGFLRNLKWSGSFNVSVIEVNGFHGKFSRSLENFYYKRSFWKWK